MTDQLEVPGALCPRCGEQMVLARCEEDCCGAMIRHAECHTCGCEMPSRVVIEDPYDDAREIAWSNTRSISSAKQTLEAAGFIVTGSTEGE